MGLLDSLLGQNGALGLGGLGGFNQATTAQMQPLLGGMYNPDDMRKIQIKNMLLGAGMGLLSQKPSPVPISFGESLGAGLSGGVEQAQKATDAYRQNALMGWQLQNQVTERKHTQDIWDAQNAVTDGLSPQEKAIAKGDFNAWAQNKMLMDQLHAQGALAAAATGDAPQTTSPLYSLPAINGGVGGRGVNTGANGQIIEAPVQQNGQQGTMQTSGSFDPTVAHDIPKPIENGPIFDPAKVPLPANMKMQVQIAAQSRDPAALNNALKLASDYRNGIAAQQKEAYFNSPEYKAKVSAAETSGKATGEATASFKSLTSKLPGLQTVVGQLNDLADQATYTYTGQGRDAVASEMGIATNGSIARAKYMAMVNDQILPMLRDTFGAQFTAREGDSLKQTLGDPNTPPAVKKAVIQTFIEQKIRDAQATGVQAGITPAANANTSVADPLGIRQ